MNEPNVNDSQEKASNIAELIIDELPEPMASIIQSCVILHWFNQPIVEALLQVIPQDDLVAQLQISDIYNLIVSLPFVESMDGRASIQDSTRERLLRRYILKKRETLILGAVIAAPIYAAYEDKIIVAEALFCYIIAGNQKTSEELLNELLEKANIDLDWQFIGYVLRLQDEAETLDFVQPVARTEQQWMLRGLLHRFEGDGARSLVDYSEAISINPESVLAFLSKGVAYAELQQYNNALEEFKYAISLDPDCLQAYYNRAILYAKLERLLEALDDFYKVLELEPNNLSSLMHLSAILLKLRRYREALEMYDRILSLNPDSFDAQEGKIRAIEGIEASDKIFGAAKNESPSYLVTPSVRQDNLVSEEDDGVSLLGDSTPNESKEQFHTTLQSDLSAQNRRERFTKWRRNLLAPSHRIIRHRQRKARDNRVHQNDDHPRDFSGYVLISFIVVCFIILISVFSFGTKIGGHPNDLTPTVSPTSTLSISPTSLVSPTSTPKISATQTSLIAPPTARSMLVVMLDRSLSLTATDPEEYSTSITKILTDIWPGSMAVILVTGTGTEQLKILGPNDLRNLQARDNLKNQIEENRNRLSGYTPLARAMQDAYALLTNTYRAGSRAILITDGVPSTPGDVRGVNQTQEIENIYIPEFYKAGIPVNTFGLTIQDANANALLQKINDGTGGKAIQPYIDVTNSSDLGDAVIGLYNKWGGLQLQKLTNNSGYSQHVDNFASEVDFLTFRNTSSEQVTVQGPNHSPISANSLDQTNDVHYQFDGIVLPTVSPAGNYSVNVTSGSADVAVYALEKSRLKLTFLLSNPETTTIPVFESLPITVALYDGNPKNHLHPNVGEAAVKIHYTIQAHGQVVSQGTEVLTQQSPPNDDLFSNQITPTQAGTLTITITASYQLVTLESQTVVLSVGACSSGTIPCFWQQQQISSLVIGVPLPLLIVLIIIWLIWLIQPTPTGILSNVILESRRARRNRFGEPEPELFNVHLGQHRSFSNKLFHRSAITSRELQDYPGISGYIQLAGKNFELIAKKVTNKPGKPKGMYIRKPKDEKATLNIKRGGNSIETVEQGHDVLLQDNDIIQINNEDIAKFSR